MNPPPEPAQAAQDIEKIVSQILEDKIAGELEKAVSRLLSPAARLEELKRKEYLTEQEFGILYSISPAAIRSERSRGFGPRYVKDGRRILYSRQELVKYFEARQVKTRIRS